MKTSPPIITPDQSQYGTARSLSSFLSGVGWVVVVIGVFLLLGSVIKITADKAAEGWIVLVIAGATLLFGLVIVAIGQIVRAVVDTADNTARIARIFDRKDIQTPRAVAVQKLAPSDEDEPEVYTIPAR